MVQNLLNSKSLQITKVQTEMVSATRKQAAKNISVFQKKKIIKSGGNQQNSKRNSLDYFLLDLRRFSLASPTARGHPRTHMISHRSEVSHVLQHPYI